KGCHCEQSEAISARRNPRRYLGNGVLRESDGPRDIMITDIVFDLGKVLVPFDWDIAFRRLRPHLPPNLAALLDHDRKSFVDLVRDPSVQLETGKIDFDHYRKIVTDILSVQLSEQEFRWIWCDIFWEDREIISLGRDLSSHYRTWLASNTSRAHYQWIVENFPDVVFYKKAALSFELGVMKPSREYYRKALNLFGIEPGSAVFIDDLKENVDAAIEFGMMGIVFQGRGQLVHGLKELNVRVPDAKEFDN
ncbi:MAG: HAD family phosphatase, partial [Desulfomonilaceae bacterium]|nr:HAD family phosphatase [Desulfomonilaceae bacterium]